MFDFFRSLFRTAPPSGETAKERLKLVLLSDHLSLAPDVVDSLKRDLMDVISRYVEIDTDHSEVTFEHREHEIAMLANIPITAVRERPLPYAPPAPEPVTSDSAPAVDPFFGDPIADATNEPDAAIEAEQPAAHEEPPAVRVAQEEPEPEPEPEPETASANGLAQESPASNGTPQQLVPARAANGSVPRRRRRKKNPNAMPPANRAVQPSPQAEAAQ